MGNGRSALLGHEGEATVHAPLGREKEDPAARRCAALNDTWPGFVDAFVGTVHAGGAAAAPPPPGARGVPPAVPRAVRPAAERLVAIGDLHGACGDATTCAQPAAPAQCGAESPTRTVYVPSQPSRARGARFFPTRAGDYEKTREALRLGGLIDAADRWSGGATVAVQVGDQLDRGGGEIRILHLLERLKREAAAAGGELIVMNGNHEAMNVAGRFRYCSPAGLAEFARWRRTQALGAALKGACGLPAGACAHGGAAKEGVPAEAAPRAAALCPGVRWPGLRVCVCVWGRNAASHTRLGLRSPVHAFAARSPLSPAQCPLARRFLAAQPTVVLVGSTAFAHGGLLAEHAAHPGGFDALNAASAAWMWGAKGGPAHMPAFLAGPRAVVWSRHYSHPEASRNDCGALTAALAATGAARVVVGHTIQAPHGINAACGGAALRIDVGMSAGCGGAAPQVLEILRDGAEQWALRRGEDGVSVLRERVRNAGDARVQQPAPMEEERQQEQRRRHA
jgi:hypothetical protein